MSKGKREGNTPKVKTPAGGWEMASRWVSRESDVWEATRDLTALGWEPFSVHPDDVWKGGALHHGWLTFWRRPKRG